MEPLKLMAILAHPDDESMGFGGVLARYGAEGVETHLLTATRGEKGWWGPRDFYPGPDDLGYMRELELRAAANILHLRDVKFLNYIDGELDHVNQDEAVAKIVAHIRRVRPQVVLTFDPYGAYGHPDHIAIHQMTMAAVAAAADSAYGDGEPHTVSKVYYLLESKSQVAAYEKIFGALVMDVDGIERRWAGAEEWMITTRIDTEAYWEDVWKAIACHRSQLPGYENLLNLPEREQAALWREQTFYRAMSLVNGGSEIEDDLFEGLRERELMIA